MAAGDLTLTHHGSYDISGAALFTTVNALNITPQQFISGARMFLVPTANGRQISVYKIVMA